MGTEKFNDYRNILQDCQIKKCLCEI